MSVPPKNPRKKVTIYDVGDLIRVRPREYGDDLIYRPDGFPYGKVGLVAEIEPQLKEYTTYVPQTSPPRRTSSYRSFPWDDDYGYYEYRSYYSDLIVVLIDGQKFWVFQEEIEKFAHEED